MHAARPYLIATVSLFQITLPHNNILRNTVSTLEVCKSCRFSKGIQDFYLKTMLPLEESENGDIQFQWGKRRGISLANKKVQFYESFIYDEQSYSLYDNVFLFKDDESEPYIGKILKIWEQPQEKRRVKILWFFRPADIMNYLGDYPVSEKELFLAYGEGAGVSNVNSLEAIAGKCSVICTSTDEKNIQPSGTALANADFIFSRFFDVGSCTLSEKVPENIAGIELKFLLNQPENLKLDHSVKLEAVDLGVAFVDTPIKKLEQSDDFVKLPLDIQVASDLAEKKLTMKSEDGYLDNNVPSKVRPVDGLIKHTYADQEKNDLITKKRKYVSDEDCLNDDSIYVLKASPQLAEPAEVKDNLLDALPQKPNSIGLHRSRWFADMPWKTRIEKAHSQGKLLFLDNLDPSYSSSEIEDLLHEALKIDCTVKIIPHVTFQNPHYAQAYVICNTRIEAKNVVQELDEKCLILSDGRPVSAKFGMFEVPQKAAKFPGHLKIDKSRLPLHRTEHKEALSTSHCSQPNTIEYELALDWLLLYEKYSMSKQMLFKKQYGQLRGFIGKYTEK